LRPEKYRRKAEKEGEKERKERDVRKQTSVYFNVAAKKLD